ncbi:MAG: helix-turn-helix domain-containing protein [Bacteroidales bacterium]|nr:helix-turn-helix domain-containing protein [Bacteroidales bacterium]
MTERLQKIMDYAGVSPNKFAAILGIQRSSISHMMSGRNNPSLTVVQKILKSYPDISAEWLLFGEGNMLKDDNNGSDTNVGDPEPPHPTPEGKTQRIDNKPTDLPSPEPTRTKVNNVEPPRDPVPPTIEQATAPSTQMAPPASTPVDTPKQNIEYQTIAAPINSATNVQPPSAQIQTMLANGLIVLDHNTKTFTVYSPSV